MKNANDVLKGLGIQVASDVKFIRHIPHALRVVPGNISGSGETSRAGMRKSLGENLRQSIGLAPDLDVRKALNVEGDQGYATPSVFDPPVNTHAEHIQGALPPEVAAVLNSIEEADYFNPRHGDDHQELNPVNMAADPQHKFLYGNKSVTSVSEDDLLKAFGAFDSEDEEGEREGKEQPAKGGQEFRTKGPGGDGKKRVMFGDKPQPKGAARERQKLEQAERRRSAETPEPKLPRVATKSALDDVVSLVKGDLAWMQHPGDPTMLYRKEGIKTIFSPTGKDHFVTVDGNHVSYTHAVGEEENSLTRTFPTSKEAMIAGWAVAVSAKGLASGKLDGDHVDESTSHGDHEKGTQGGISRDAGHKEPTVHGKGSAASLDGDHVNESDTHDDHGGARTGALGGHDNPMYGTGSGKLDADHVDESGTHDEHKSLGEVLDDLSKAMPGYPGSQAGADVERVIGHALDGAPIHQGKIGPNPIRHWGADSSTPGRYVAQEGDHAPYGGENHHIHYHHTDSTKEKPHRDYLGHVVQPHGEGHWAAVYSGGKPKNFGTREAAENHLLGIHAAKFKGPKLKIAKGGVEALLKAAEEKMEQTMHEFKHGTLHSGSKKGPVVKDRKQAIAIGLKQSGQSNQKSEPVYLLDLSKAEGSVIATTRSKLKRAGKKGKETSVVATTQEQRGSGHHGENSMVDPGHVSGADGSNRGNAPAIGKSALDEMLDLLKGGGQDDRGKPRGGEKPLWAMKDPGGHGEELTAAAQDRLEREKQAGGEGSRGGKIIGHTRSGKPIYDTFGHARHQSFTSADHEDAAKAHYHVYGLALRNRRSAESPKLAVTHEQMTQHLRAQHELRAHGINGATKKSELDEVLDLLKARAADEIETSEEVKTGGGHHKHVVDAKQVARKEGKYDKPGIVKASGPGGMLLDFGLLTGNPIADRLMLEHNRYGEQTQRQIIAYQDKTHREALVELVEKGEARYATEHQTPGETVDPERQEAFLKAKAEVNQTTIHLGRDTAVAQSETDKAVVEMAKAEGLDSFAAQEAAMIAGMR